MPVALRDVSIWAIQLHQILKSSDGQQQKAWLVSAKCNSMRFMNDIRMLRAKFLELPAQQGKNVLLTLYLIKRRQPNLKGSMRGKMQFLSIQNVILQLRENFS